MAQIPLIFRLTLLLPYDGTTAFIRCHQRAGYKRQDGPVGDKAGTSAKG